MPPSRTSSTIQTTSSAAPSQKEIQGPGPGTRSTEPAQAAIGSAQIRLEASANPNRPHRSRSRNTRRTLLPRERVEQPCESAPASRLLPGGADRLGVLAARGGGEHF